jgi:hypothetical protein
MGWQDEYDQVEDRLAKFWENNPNGRIFTEHLSISPDHQSIVVRALIYKDIEDINPVATGIAQDQQGPKGANITSWIENAETSAIGRGLANWFGYTAKARPSVTEMQKVENLQGNAGQQVAKQVTKSVAKTSNSNSYTPPQSVQKKTEGAVTNLENKSTEQALEALGVEVEEKKFVTQGSIVPQCLSCSSELWDNRQDKASGKIKETYPDWKCKNRECDNGNPRIYYMESFNAEKQAPEEWFMPKVAVAKSVDDVEEGEIPF